VRSARPVTERIEEKGGGREEVVLIPFRRDARKRNYRWAGRNKGQHFTIYFFG
jgi:hypothetical protein